MGVNINNIESLPKKTQILASNRNHYWALSQKLDLDYFDFLREGRSALLLLGMHLTDPRPWASARNPVLVSEEGGYIDQESKRILGKRYRPFAEHPPPFPLVEVDPFERIMTLTEANGHNYKDPAHSFPGKVKVPGRLFARELIAKAVVRTEKGTSTFYSRNFSEISQCLHAELTLLFAIARDFSTNRVSKIETFEIETTLKPCRMCAAFLEAVKAKSESFCVRYENEDPGPLAKNTLLDRKGYTKDHLNTVDPLS